MNRKWTHPVLRCEGCDSPFLSRKPWRKERFCSRHCGGTDRVFWSKVNKSPGYGPRGDCWAWTGYKRDGYGQWRGNGAHRHSYELIHGSIPTGMVVMHSCDIRDCVNPAHLSVGTITENVADCVSKQRQARGESKASSKLSPQEIVEIRALLAEGRSRRSIAPGFDVSKTTISEIATRKLWGWVQ